MCVTLRSISKNKNLVLVDIPILTFVDNVFFDFPYHLNLDTWDETPKFSKEDYLKYLKAFNDVNSCRTTILFAWCFFTTISYLAEAIGEAKWKPPHKFTQINTFKQDFNRAVPYDSVCEEVLYFVKSRVF